MSDVGGRVDQAAVRRIAQVQRFLNGRPVRQVELAGLTTDSATVTLPPARAELSAGLGRVLRARRSHYRFGTAVPSAEQLGSLLRWALGPQRTVRTPDGQHRQLSMAPTAGGLASVSAYVAVRPSGDLPAGVFGYHSAGHQLRAVWSGDPTAALRSVLVQPEFADRAPLVVILVARLDTTLVKYPIRHYRTLHVDSGIAVQNLYLVATALELAGCAVTAFDDGAVAELLALPDTMFPTVLFPLGCRPGAG